MGQALWDRHYCGTNTGAGQTLYIWDSNYGTGTTVRQTLLWDRHCGTAIVRQGLLWDSHCGTGTVGQALWDNSWCLSHSKTIPWYIQRLKTLHLTDATKRDVASKVARLAFFLVFQGSDTHGQIQNRESWLSLNMSLSNK